MSQKNQKWVKSSFCTQANCVEVAENREMIAVRDSKCPEGSVLLFTHNAWRAFLDGVRAGDFTR